MMLAENSLFHAVGQIFHPVFIAVGWVLAFIYGLIPNYAVAIALLTIVIMLLLTPLTVKSTRSMIAMQALQPEIKKLQTKYKGAENRQKLNEEMMALYKEKGINPAGGCLPMFLQMPFLIILYDTIRGLTNVVTVGGKSVAQPRYIPKPPSLSAHAVPLVDKLYVSLYHAGGTMVSFGMDLAKNPFSHGLTTAQRIPFFAFVLAAVVLQYFQMRAMNSRNPQATANKQMQTIQKITPILFAYIYFIVPAAVVIYMIISTLIRIVTQDIMFRTGMVALPGTEREIGGAKRRNVLDAPASGLVEEPAPELKPGGGTTNGSKAPPPRNGRPSASKARAGRTTGSTQKPTHPRSRGKRPRKAR